MTPTPVQLAIDNLDALVDKQRNGTGALMCDVVDALALVRDALADLDSDVGSVTAAVVDGWQ